MQFDSNNKLYFSIHSTALFDYRIDIAGESLISSCLDVIAVNSQFFATNLTRVIKLFASCTYEQNLCELTKVHIIDLLKLKSLAFVLLSFQVEINYMNNNKNVEYLQRTLRVGARQSNEILVRTADAAWQLSECRA